MDYSYSERDFAFGQTMLTVRTVINLTQSSLAQYLGVSRRAVGDWEAGNKYPKAANLKQFIALAIKHQAFEAGREAEEIRSLWQTARQKVRLDEVSLTELLSSARTSQPHQATITPKVVSSQVAMGEVKVDWGDAPSVPTFYGRASELTELRKWVVEEECRVVSLLGLGGIGKSALAVNFMHQVSHHFEVVIWRSLRDAPDCETLVNGCLEILAPETLNQGSFSLEQRFSLLLKLLQSRRVLLVLDNLETLLEGGQNSGSMRPGYEDYSRLLRRVAETTHQSCVLLTSREKPIVLAALEGSLSPVRVLRLARLDTESCEQLLLDKDVAGSSVERAQLSEIFAGNPLALKMVAQTVVDLFEGEIAPFLEQGEVIFGGVRELLDQQFARLSPLEQTVLRWLAIMREPATLDELFAVLGKSTPRVRLLEAVEALYRRSLIERGEKPGSFTLQSVVLEYLSVRLNVEVADEPVQDPFTRPLETNFVQGQLKDYLQQSQDRYYPKTVPKSWGDILLIPVN